jgi:hypothetical protein
MGYIVANIAYGTGPYIRITELCIAFNDALERAGRARMPFIVPLVYGERQRSVMLEEFSDHAKMHPHEVLLDGKLGELLGSIFYANSAYEDALERWVGTARTLSEDIRTHLSGTFPVQTLEGTQQLVSGADIALEINRSPRVRFGVAPAYSTTFGYITDILERALAEPTGAIDTDKLLLERGVKLAHEIESAQTLRATAYPGTFSWEPAFRDRFDGQLVPPITSVPKPHSERVEEGIFVTITGIPGLERLYSQAEKLGLKLYSNIPQYIPGSIKALPSVVANPAIRLQFARSGWGSVWHSMLCGTPIVVPRFDPKDDPEIYFNNKAVEQLGIGIVYQGQALPEILSAGAGTLQRSTRFDTGSVGNSRWQCRSCPGVGSTLP